MKKPILSLIFCFMVTSAWGQMAVFHSYAGVWDMSLNQVKEIFGNDFVVENYTSDEGKRISSSYTWKDIQKNCISGTTMLRYRVNENKPFAVEEDYEYFVSEFDIEGFLTEFMSDYGIPDQNNSAGGMMLFGWTKGDWFITLNIFQMNKYFGAHMYPIYNINVMYRPIAEERAQLQKR